ncbi:glycosyltransferase family 2 protein [Herbiconiux sp. L3-i23]|uniref:glycosyltransferase family 2 protein n=1 Tax=Herbiconiux sp. L3-i23 TaxID=2905871 RepID=UPI002053970F|nr:glycosyltransferase family 2 protein [Herbiconiux sp. L3-i23]BDI22481.1 glycosyl hydrolase [Herbiconiux sp. L3-i23]
MPRQRIETISVVIPVKDDVEELRRCLVDLSRQTRPADEVVVVDNASSRDVGSVARAMGARVVPEGRPGIPAAAATGFDAARGDLIARCDADSRLPGDWLERMVDAFDDPHVGAVSGPGRFYGLTGVARAFDRPLSWAYMGAYRLAAGTALGHPPLFGSNLAVRSGLWRAIRDDVHLTPDLHDDMDLSFHVGERARIVFDPALTVGISADPLRGGAFTRLARGFRSVFVHWPHDLPPLRWARLSGRALRRRLRTV